MNKTYTIEYRPHSGSQTKFVEVVADDKEEAYNKGIEKIEELESEWVWVYAVKEK